MRLRIEQFFRRLPLLPSRTRISTKITLLYAAILFVVLIFTSVVMGVGIYFSFYHQAEKEINISMHHVMRNIETGKAFSPGFWQSNPLLPGVVMRVTDITGEVVYDTDPRYPSLGMIESGRMKNWKPFWASDQMDVARVYNMAVYHATGDFTYEGQVYRLHFLRTITSETDYLATLQRMVLVTTIIGFIIALIAGYFLSNRILKPLRTMTQTVRKIEVENMDRRIEVPPSKDEMAELAETFNHMLDRLQAGFKQQQQFVSDASHELRTPVTVILGYSDLLSRWGRSDKEVLDEGIASICSEAENMQQLIEKLLFLARADQKRQVLHKEMLELSELIADVVKKMQIVAKDHTVTLGVNDAALIYADPVTIRQMLRIFLDNAVKYTPAGGTITIASKLCPDRKHILVTLADTGIGIAKEEQERIFERFYRVDTSRTKIGNGVGGTGLGLSIARWIAAQHDIAIRVESEPGQGTTFFLTIPLVDEND